MQTEAIWRLAAELGIPRMVFVNKLDRERADFERTLDQLRDRFGAGVAPLELPIGAGGRLPGRRRPAHRHRLVLRGRHRPPTARSPTTWRSSSTRSTTTWSRASSSPTTTCSSGTSTATCRRSSSSSRPSPRGVDEATVFPVVCGSATAGVAVDRLADFICEIGPSPARPAAGHGRGRRHHRRGRTRSRRPAARVRVQDGRRPVRRPHLAVQGAVGHDPGRRPPRQQPLGHRRAPARPVHACGATSRSRRSVVRAGDIAAVAEAVGAPSPATRWPRRARR